MKKKALKKEFRVEVKKSLNRFLSIFFIVAMGVAFFTGIHASAPDMRATGDYYYDLSSLMDFRVISTLGLTDGDLDTLREIDGMELVEGCYMEDVYSGDDAAQIVLHIESIPEHLNVLTAAEGRLPEQAGECFLDSAYAAAHGIKPGDILEFTVSSEEDSMLRHRSYTVTGYGYSPCYISFDRGTTTLGTGELAAFVYVPAEEFDAEVYSVAYLAADGARELESYSEEYDALIEEVYDRIEAISDTRCEIRYQEVMDEATEALDEGKQEVEDGKQELEDAKAELAEAESEAEKELAEAESELLEGEEKLADGKQELADARKELAEGESELAEGEQEIADNEVTMEDARVQIADAVAQLNSGEAEYQSGLTQYEEAAEEAEPQMDHAQQQISSGKVQLEEGWIEYYANLAMIDEGEAALVQAEEQLTAGQAQYDAAYPGTIQQLDAGLAQYNLGMTQYMLGMQAYDAGYAQLLESQQTYDAGRAELDAGWAQYYAGREQYDAGQAAFDAAVLQAEPLRNAYDAAGAAAAGLQAQYDAAVASAQALQSAYEAEAAWIVQLENEYAQGQGVKTQEELDALLAQIQTAKQALPAKKAEAEAAAAAAAGIRPSLDAANAQYAAVKAQYDPVAAELAQQQAVLAGTAATLDASKQMLDQKEAEMTAAKAQLDAGWTELTLKKGELDAAQQQLTGAKAELDAGYAALEQARTDLESGWAQIETKKAELIAGRAALAEAKQTLLDSEETLYYSQSEADAGRQELTDAKTQLSSARQELNLGWAQLSASQAQLADGERQLEDARTQISDARVELEDARGQIAEAESEIAENEQKLSDGWIEYEEGKAEAESEIAEAKQKIADAEAEIADAEQEIADAEAEIADIRMTKWYIDDRTALPEHAGFGENADRMSSLARVFPLLFFLVAALISLTTMTRMVEEERTQIGTMKALGYSRSDIAGKYLKYAFFATVGGSIFGTLFGEKVFPWVIITAYSIIYVYLPQIVIPYNLEFALLATGAAMFCTIGATWSACRRALQEVPAQLMRPPAPKEGKRVLLEYLPFIWKPLKFTWKSTIRNLMRYKKRFFMTIVGIGGCMGLLLVGYGLRDSIMGIGDRQFDCLQMYDAMVILDTDASQQEQDKAAEIAQNTPDITQYGKYYMQLEEIQTGEKTGKEWSAYVYVPEDMTTLYEFFAFRKRSSEETYTLTDRGAIITEKIAKELGIEAGDTVVLEREDGEDAVIPVTAVCENYLAHYIYMTPALYEEVFGEKPEYNCMFYKSDADPEGVKEIGGSLLESEAVLNISYSSDIREQLNSMLVALDMVIIVLIVAAGMLAFVVLYNLNNININERRRELATLKVLGFHDGEVASYVYRENVLLTIFGCGLGIVIGRVLHLFIITTVEVDNTMFGRNINAESFVIGTLFTILFSCIVNFVMYFKLKKIDMVESLKSIE